MMLTNIFDSKNVWKFMNAVPPSSTGATSSRVHSHGADDHEEPSDWIRGTLLS